MQHWSKIIPIGAWPQGHLLHCACSLVDPNVLSSSRFHHLHQESADKSHTWLPCPPPDLSVAEEEVVGLDPKLLVLWGEGRAGGPCINAWMLCHLDMEEGEDIATKMRCYSNMHVFLFRFNYHGELVPEVSPLQQVCTTQLLTKLWC